MNGHAIAGGCVLTLCCDWRVVVEEPKVKTGLNEVALGLVYPPRVLEIVRRRVPQLHHEAVILGAGLFGPATACKLGLVDAVEKDARAAAEAWLKALSAHPKHAYAAAKRALRGARPEDLCPDDVARAKMRELLPAWTSTELKERVLARLRR